MQQANTNLMLGWVKEKNQSEIQGQFTKKNVFL